MYFLLYERIWRVVGGYNTHITVLIVGFAGHRSNMLFILVEKTLGSFHME